MITLFNRREAYITYSMQEQSEIRSLLAQNGIDYSVKVINRKSPSPADAGSRARTGSFGENPGLMYIFSMSIRTISKRPSGLYRPGGNERRGGKSLQRKKLSAFL